MNGIIIVDKPSGWTSHDVIAKLRGALKEKRIGHGGTLDPIATGVLPVFVGRATRAAEFCENAEKEYIAGLRLGLVTDTQDVTGNPLSENEADVPAEVLAATLTAFLGKQSQMPPMYSAIKQDGKKLYELARRGIDVPRPAREITIMELCLLGGGGNEYQLRVACSKGTYIRTLCHDIGAALSCGGAMSSLRRTRAGAFTIGMAHTLEEILAAAASGAIENLMESTDSIFAEHPAFKLDMRETRRCSDGSPCRAEGAPDGRYRFYGPDNEFLCLGDATGGNIRVIKRFL